jgi:outer membrane protein OmpA-like peptidoglycan-associated protein
VPTPTPATTGSEVNVVLGFKLGVSALTADQKKALLKAGLKANAVVTVVGYASPSNSSAADQKLALARANSVKAQILALVPSATVTVVSKGSTNTASCVTYNNQCAIVSVQQ